MTTSPANEAKTPTSQSSNQSSGVKRILRSKFVRELLIVLAFCLLTSILTWPYVGQLRSAVAGPGDPYLITWSMWWDYHQTFRDPLNLFHTNTFYPYRYTLAFSETCYGLALPFFPLYALGLKPLTVHAVAMFFGFALSGYGAFRFTRTITGSYGAAWVAGIMFGFIPYRFNLMAQLMYLFSLWIPLLFESLVLFIKVRSWKRAIWMGVAFFMTGLTTITWLLMAVIPFAVIAIVLLTRHELWKDRDFWKRSIVTIGVAGIALLPFTVPFLIVKKLYGFKRGIDDVRAHSAQPIHWLVAEGRSKIWHGMGSKIPDAWKFQLFPGLLPLLLPLPEVLRSRPSSSYALLPQSSFRKNVLRFLDIVIFAIFPIAIITAGFNAEGELFREYLTSERVWGVLSLALFVRLCIEYPMIIRRGQNANLIDTLRSPFRSDAFWIGALLVVIGFIFSIGWHFFIWRLLYYLMPGFQSIRAPMRGAMFAYLGLSVLSGLGVMRLAAMIPKRIPRFTGPLVFVAVCLLLSIELNGAPLYFIHGDVDPDQVTLRLKELPMRGGITYFPAGIDYNQRYMLRAADHEKPLILGTSGFSPPIVSEFERMTAAGRIPSSLMDLMEQIPASYLVVMNRLIPNERKPDFQQFLVREVQSGRLRFINRFDDSNDLYAIVKTEPEAKSEGPLPEELSIRDWASAIQKDPVELLGQPLSLSQRLYRVYLTTTGSMPRHDEFMRDLEEITRGVIVGSEQQEQNLKTNFDSFLQAWTNRQSFVAGFGHLDNASYVNQLLNNAGVVLDQEQRQSLIDGLNNSQETRATVLSKIVDDQRLIEKEKYRSIIDLHYFAYLRRNPQDPPETDMRGFNFWLQDMEQSHNIEKLATAFGTSLEYLEKKKQQ